MRLIIGLIILSFVCFSCNSNDTKTTNNTASTSQPKTTKTTKPLIQIDQLLSNEGYINIPLNIVEQTTKDGYLVNRVQAMYKDDLLELLVSLKENVPAGFVDEMPKNTFLVEGIIFESTGPKSDRLLTTLAQKYQINTGKLTMKSKQVFTCANFNRTPIDYKSGNPKFKIFLEGGGEVAELYVNFDFKKSLVYLNEKDPQYREGVIKLLGE